MLYSGVGKGIGFIEQRLWAGIKIRQVWVGPDYRWPSSHWTLGSASPKHWGSYLTFVRLYSFISFILSFPIGLLPPCGLSFFSSVLFTALSLALETLSSTG